MNLTNGQLTTLATAINGRAELVTARNLHDAAAVANFYNGVASSPAVNVWSTRVAVDPTINASIQWRDFQVLAVQLQNTYIAMTQSGAVNMADQGTARGLVGTSGQSDGVFADGTTSSANIRAASIRAATFFEALFSSVGGGTLSTSNVCSKDKDNNSLFGQLLDAATVAKAMGW